MKTRLFFVLVLRFVGNVVKFFAAIAVNVVKLFAAIAVIPIFICIPFVLGIVILSTLDGAEFFAWLCLSIPLVIATTITRVSIGGEVKREVRRQRQIHRVQAMLEHVEELQTLAERLGLSVVQLRPTGYTVRQPE